MPEGTLELSSTKFMERDSSARMSFYCERQGLLGTSSFQAMAMREGLLLLKLQTKKKPNPAGLGNILRLLAASSASNYQSGALGTLLSDDTYQQHQPSTTEFHERFESYAMADEEEIWSVASTRKMSLLIDFADINSVSIDPPPLMSGVVGCVRMSTAGSGRIKLLIDEHPELSHAIELFESRLPEIVKVNVEINPKTMLYRAVK